MKKSALFILISVFSSVEISLAGDFGLSASVSDTLMDMGASVGEAVLDDGKYLLSSVLNDTGDILKAPFAVGERGVVNTKSVLTGALVLGSIPATIYGLDNPIRRNVRKMNDGTAGPLQNIGLGMTIGGLGAVYGWGILSRNEGARHVALTGLEGMGVASLLGLGAEAAFGRRRPREGGGPRGFFKGGESFPSGKSILAFSAATALSEGFKNRWWATIPAYGLAVMTGIGRMGKDAHWASDILASALIGVGTTKLLFYLHRQREVPSSLVITPMVTERGAVGARLNFTW
ncbi:MAG: phosphatase PAP2 family protein [Candidatus Binatia bacterium]